MQSLMQSHVAAIRKGLVANGALVGLFACVSPQVLLEQHFTGEPFRALGTLVRFYSRMNADVHIEGHPLVKGLGAVRTDILLPVPVDFQVAAQVPLVVEYFPTLGTVGGKLFGALVDGQVVLVVAQLRESLSAFLALVP